MVCLLKGMTEIEGADALGLRTSSFHQVVVKVYRKFGVGSRAQLLALFMQEPPRVATPWTAPLMDFGHPAVDAARGASKSD